MKFVDKLLQETDFLQQLQKLEQLEKNRQFCRHGLQHLLDTARIAWIAYLEQQQDVNKSGELEKEMIYLAALLHDMGRIQEYEAGVSHHVASAAFAEKYLAEIGYPAENVEVIVSAVYGHRKHSGESAGNTEKSCGKKQSWEVEQGIKECLGELLYFADKKSRTCFACEAAETCNWAMEKRNTGITI